MFQLPPDVNTACDVADLRNERDRSLREPVDAGQMNAQAPGHQGTHIVDDPPRCVVGGLGHADQDRRRDMFELGNEASERGAKPIEGRKPGESAEVIDDNSIGSRIYDETGEDLEGRLEGVVVAVDQFEFEGRAADTEKATLNRLREVETERRGLNGQIGAPQT